MIPLIDGDILRYEIGFCGEYEEDDEETGEAVKKIREWEFVQKLLDDKIKFICDEVGATQPPIIFITGSETSVRIVNRRDRYKDVQPVVMVRPFREDIATIKPYKGTRKGVKPFHFDNITAHLLANYDCDIAFGIEADDRMAQTQSEGTIICSRDKDLRMVPGWHYGWECGKQASFGPEIVDAKGWLKYDYKGDVKGAGLKFFFYQMLVGDTVDNIPGCAKIGPKKAMDILAKCETKREHELAIIEAYKKAYGDNWQWILEEQSKLLWMIKEMSPEGLPVYYDWKFE